MQYQDKLGRKPNVKPQQHTLLKLSWTTRYGYGMDAVRSEKTEGRRAKVARDDLQRTKERDIDMHQRSSVFFFLGRPSCRFVFLEPTIQKLPSYLSTCVKLPTTWQDREQARAQAPRKPQQHTLLKLPWTTRYGYGMEKLSSERAECHRAQVARDDLQRTAERDVDLHIEHTERGYYTVFYSYLACFVNTIPLNMYRVPV